MNNCLCDQCKNNEYNISEYLITEEDLKILDNERPLGISGHLRVINEAMTVGECIESCIDFLDELVITYNTSVDNTEEILKKYEKKYPDKIRLFHYKPSIFRFNKEEYNKKYSQIHYMANYSNYGIVKIKYRYYVKIDADQIYFTDKLLELREALFSDINIVNKDIKRLLFLNKIAWWIPFKNIRNIFRTSYIRKYFKKDKNYHFYGYKDVLSFKDFILFSRIVNQNIKFEFGGFNLALKDNQFYLNIDYPINGAGGDTSLFVATSKTYYFIGAATEHFFADYNMCYAGFFWLHFGLIKREMPDEISNIKVLDISNISEDSILEYINNSSFYNNEIYIDWYKKMVIDFAKYYFNEDKKYITKDFYDKYLINPLEYAIKQKGNFAKRVAF